MRGAAVCFGSALLLLSCQGQDAYLGTRRTAYECGKRCAIEQGAPSDAGEWFSNPVARLGEAPKIVYPLPGSIHPHDLRQLTVQFRRGRSDFSVFRLRVTARASGVEYDFFAPCLAVAGDGCRFVLQGPLWDAARAELLGKPAEMSVTGSTARDGVLLVSQAVPLTVTPSQLQNKGFYYWTSVPRYSGIPGDQDTGIFRLPFGADRAEPFIMPESATNTRQCGACHSVSRDGSTIAFTARNNDSTADQRSGVLVVTTTASPEKPFITPALDATYNSSMMALTSDGRRVLVAYDEQLALLSSDQDGFSNFAAGDVITRVTRAQLGGKLGYFPEFSPDDDAVVVTLTDQPDSAIAVRSGDIAVLDFDKLNATFSAPRVLVAGTELEFHFYPTWSPDGAYVAFASAPRELDEQGAQRKSYDQKRARLRLVARAGGPVIELGNATHAADSWSTFPKFAPFAAEEQGGLMFLTFNSKIDYGLVLQNSAMASDAGRLAQLWMSAIDVARLPADPSSPPLWLPFQDATQSSHLGFWTSDVKCRTDVGGGTGCDVGQVCEDAVCRVIVK